MKELHLDFAPTACIRRVLRAYWPSFGGSLEVPKANRNSCMIRSL
jgi:hypothetical protein